MTKRLWITTLTQHMIEHWRQTGDLVLVHGHRPKAERCVEHLLIDRHALLHHLTVITNLLDGNFAHLFGKQISNSTMEGVIAAGLKILTDEHLAQLIVHPLDLLSLHYKIERTPSLHWQLVKEHEDELHYTQTRH